MAQASQKNTEAPTKAETRKRVRRLAPIPPGAICLWPLEEVEPRTGLRKTKLYEMTQAGEFPKPIKVGGRSLWPSSAVEAWIADRIAGQTGDA